MAAAGIMRAVMFLRHTKRKKDGKEHRYWSIVENRRVGGGRVVQRPLLYLGEINDSQELAWRKSIAVLEEGAAAPRTLSLFPEDRCEGVLPDAAIVRLKLTELRLCRPRQWGGCWLALNLWRELALDRFWAERLGPSRKGTRWHQVLLLLATYRLLAPGSEWRLHRQWFEGSAMADLLGEDVGLAEIHKLYRCHDRLLEHKQALFDHLVGRWRDLFNVSFDVLLYDLTSTYFESDPPFPEGDKRRHGYSRDHRGDCVQVIIALVVTPEGLPLAYEVLPGNTADNTTLKDFLARIVAQYGKARRIWLMDRGVPTEAVLAEMRAADPPVQYLVGTPKGRLTRLEKGLVDKPWQRRPAGRTSQAAATGRRALCLRPKHRPGCQGTGDTPSPAEMVVGTAQAVGRHEAQSRRVADAARCRAQASPDGLASNRNRGRCGQRRTQLSPRSREAAPRPAARGPVSLAHQSHRRRSGAAVGLLPPARQRRGGVQEPQRRPRHPADLSPGRSAHRGAYLHRLPRLLPPCHTRPAPPCPGAWPHAAQRHRKVRRRADD